ncbi:MAG: co-chaperone GroES [Syntrophales bacterium]|jgi:chaperonin GroES|nr:co-chaperone GroES [Syntrophales bacterium]MDY0044805.1 co-chaperone GroES [Syntrophales bacterium]
MKVKPLHDRVLVLRIEADGKSKGGIIIPDSAREKPIEGKIVAVGGGRKDEKGNRIPLELKEGDKVLFGKYAGTEVKVEGVEHLILKEDDIFCVCG